MEIIKVFFCFSDARSAIVGLLSFAVIGRSRVLEADVALFVPEAALLRYSRRGSGPATKVNGTDSNTARSSESRRKIA
jgi:hypothetical protein